MSAIREVVRICRKASDRHPSLRIQPQKQWNSARKVFDIYINISVYMLVIVVDVPKDPISASASGGKRKTALERVNELENERHLISEEKYEHRLEEILAPI
jgi:hypothetical protein